MQFDPKNKIVKLCALGMGLEGEGKMEEAGQLFMQAWKEAASDFEQLISAHYVARHQKITTDKLKWDEIALDLALKIADENMQALLPSLYLNVAKCYEDLKDVESAKKNYQLAYSFTDALPGDGYGKMIKTGIMDGIKRVNH